MSTTLSNDCFEIVVGCESIAHEHAFESGQDRVIGDGNASTITVHAKPCQGWG